MADWFVGLRKAAVDSRPGALEESLIRAEQALGMALPPDLRMFYGQMDGGSFEPDVALYHLWKNTEGVGVVEETRVSIQGLPASGVWRFGLRGGADHLFAAKRAAMGMEGAAEDWVYGRKNTDTGELELFKSLQALLWKLIPPVESEDFGETTYVKAMSVVRAAIAEMDAKKKKSASKAKRASKPAVAAKSKSKAKPKAKPKKPAKKSKR